MRFATLTASLVLAALLALTASADAQQKGKKKKNKKGGGALSGSIVMVERDKNSKDNDLGFITIQTKGKKGKGGKTVRVEITKQTKIARKAGGKKGGKSQRAANFSNLHRGERVVVRARNGVAQQVEIIGGRKKGKKAVASR